MVVGLIHSICICHFDPLHSHWLACFPHATSGLYLCMSFYRIKFPLYLEGFQHYCLGSLHLYILSPQESIITCNVTVFFIVHVTVGNSPTAPGTLGSYQTLDWARLAGKHAGVTTTERNHIYHLTHNIY